MADAATGNPFYEVMGTYMLGVRLVQKLPPAMSKEIGGWDAPVVYKAWEIFQKHYVQENIDIVAAYSELRYLTFWKIFSLTGDFLSSEVQRIKKDFLPKVNDYIEHYETFLRQDF